LPFFAGIAIAFLSQQKAIEQMDLALGLIILGVVIALPGYIGIWRWRWIKFKND